MTVVLLFFLAFLTAASTSNTANASTTAVSVLQSLNHQLPVVARVGQPYSWTFSPSTFSSSDGPLRYTTSTLPGWLTFDEATQTFQGTPSANDEGYPDITVTAHATSTSTSSSFTICVTHAPPPTLNMPLEQQFTEGAKPLSSVYFLRPYSALGTSSGPTLRIPRKWSFSVGIQSRTFVGASDGNVFYELRMANGSVIPEYMSFNSKTVALDGVIPSADKIPQPVFLPLVLHASDQEGYTAATLPFNLVVADHELSLSASSLPTINITISTPFSVSLKSMVDFTGVLCDGEPIQPSNISSLDIDVSNFSKWLQYDAPSRTLSGTPGDDVTGTSPLLPVTLTTMFNQTITSNVSLNLVRSFFVLPVLPAIHVAKGDPIQTSLSQWFSNSTAQPGRDGTTVTPSFEPSTAANWLRFNELTTNLTGTVPADYRLDGDHVTVTFTAFSNETHTTSHTSLDIFFTDNENTQSFAPTHTTAEDDDSKKRMALALGLTFGLVGGLCVLAGVFALVRRWARVEDTAVVGEEGRHAWSEKDRRWYGMDLSPNGTTVVEKQDAEAQGAAYNTPPPGGRPRGPRPNYGGMGLGLTRVTERSQQQTDSQEELISPGAMSKKEFLSKIKETVRQVSEKYAARKQRAVFDRPAIGKPILVSSTRASQNPGDVVQYSPSNPFDDSLVPSRPGSTFISGSPSSSTAEHPIPRRRQDFTAPRNPAQVHFEEGLLVRQVSTGSMGGNSYRSGKSGISGDSFVESAMGPPTKPRLVPFTNSRVPVPNAEAGGFAGNRIASQRAKVIKDDKGGVDDSDVKPSATVDELSMGIHYMRSLGGDQLAVNHGNGHGSSPALSNIRSSFTSLESSHMGHKSGASLTATKVLVRAGERFKFRVPVPSTSDDAGRANGAYFVRLTSGQPVPKFIQSDLSGVAAKNVLELSGVATFRDLGELSVGVYTGEGVCVATIAIEVVGKR